MSIRNTVANVVRDVTPMPMSQGLPLPEGLHVQWPRNWQAKILKFEAITDLDIKNKIIGAIRG